MVSRTAGLNSPQEERVHTGLYFGSRIVGQPSGPERSSEYICPSRINCIAKGDAFLGMYILDVWTNHQDSRGACCPRITAPMRLSSSATVVLKVLIGTFENAGSGPSSRIFRSLRTLA
jgi:hypothetical protein